MARCTLDDMVPAIKCNRVFLEPVSSIVGGEFSFTGEYEGGGTQVYDQTEYKVVFDLSVVDVVDDEDGIADYLFSDDFTKHVKYKKIYCRNNSLKELCDVFKKNYNPQTGAGMHPSLQAYVLDMLITSEHKSLVASGTHAAEQILSQVISTSPMSEDLAVFFADFRFSSKVIEKLGSFFLSDSEITADIEVPKEQSYGERFINEDGQIAYDLKLPLSYTVYNNQVTVENCSLYIIPRYDLQAAMETVGETAIASEILLDMETVIFFYKQVYGIPVLRDSRPANSKVQDFRLTERIAEIMEIDRITDYDATVDKISSITGMYKELNINVLSELYASYAGSPNNAYVIGTFFLNQPRLLTQYSKYPFLYKNAFEPRPGSSMRVATPENNTIRILITTLINTAMQLDRITLRRTRVDNPDDSVIVAKDGSIETMYSITGNVALMFTDNSFSDIEYGEYKYSIEIEYHDPMETVVETLVLGTKEMLGRLSAAMTYINNNSNSYNETRDQLSPAAINHLKSQNLQTDIQGLEDSFKALFALFSGESFSYVSGALANMQEVLESRKQIANLIRVLEDLLFEVGKFYETKDINSASLQSPKPSSYIVLQKTWNKTVKPKSNEKMILDIIGRNNPIKSQSQYGNMIRQEGLAHYSEAVAASLQASKNLGCFTPTGLDLLPIYGTNQNDVIAKLALDLMETPVTSPRHNKIVADFLGGTKQEYSEEEIKNTHGAFENMLSNLGVSVNNMTVATREVHKSSLNPARKPVSFGIEDGSNVDSSLEVGGKGEFIPKDVPDDEVSLAEQDARNAKISQALYNEFLKKEDLASRFITKYDGYNILDRVENTQGATRQTYPYPAVTLQRVIEERESRSVPFHFEGDRLTDLVNKAGMDAHTGLSEKMISRFILDNTFLVYYLNGFNANMEPVWVHATNWGAMQFLINRDGKLFCKLKRYKSSYSNVGQGAQSDRDIFLEYFYLRN